MRFLARSSIYSHVNESIMGLTTVRSSKAQKLLQEDFNYYLDTNSTVLEMNYEGHRAFGFFVDIITTTYSAVVTFTLVFITADNTDPESVGLAISQIISLTGIIQWCLRQWGELESQMTSVERVLEYCKIEPEETEIKTEPSELWPESGNIRFESTCLRYCSEDRYALKDINMTINYREKVGIVGRTGAGKSSLIWALFQLTSTSGKIFIDGIDISKIPLQSLRSKISVIPQQPVLFSGTLRKNLDPFNFYSDEDIWNALADVRLKNAVMELKLGLSYEICEGGSNFSVGQKQLICLARAIISKRKILILDEATANVDPYTDSLIQNTIRSKFQDCTVLTIAHRLNSIIDSDKVAVMNEGVLTEFDHPHRLLSNENGVFYSMVQKAGELMARNLHDAAKCSFESKYYTKANL